MTAEVVSTETGEVISHADVRDSIAIARSHGEKFFEQIVWQVENEVWGVLGYKSWDDMRDAEYADLGVVAPKSDRPELTSRLRSKGLTQKQIGDTLGVTDMTVSRELRQSTNVDSPQTITNSRGQERPATYERREPDLEGDGWTSAGEPLHKVTETTKTETYVNGETGEVMPPPNQCYPGDPHRFNDFNAARKQVETALKTLYRESSDYPHPEKADVLDKFASQLTRKANQTRKASQP